MPIRWFWIGIGFALWMLPWPVFGAATYTVTDRADNYPIVEDDTLRWAVEQANSNSDQNTITFQFIDPAANSITVLAPLVFTQPVTLNGQGTQVVGGCNTYTSIFILEPACVNSEICNLAVVSGNTGIAIHADGVRVTGCRIGIDWDDLSDRGHNIGIYIWDAEDVVIGGASSSERNVIANNSWYGIRLMQSRRAVIQGNYIGLRSDGGSTSDWQDIGIYAGRSTVGCLIGGDRLAGEGNVIARHSNCGVYLSGESTRGNSLCGNIIGLNPSQTAAQANYNYGIYFSGASGNWIGTAFPGWGNIIAGNGSYGIHIAKVGSSDPFLAGEGSANIIQNNSIGISSSGQVFPQGNGILMVQGMGNLIGGRLNDTWHERNVISGNQTEAPTSYAGVYLTGEGNTISGNYIGTDLDGDSAIPNKAGVRLAGKNNLLGGSNADPTQMYGNVISGNAAEGVYLGSSGNTVIGNFIGVNAGATAVLSNSAEGIRLATNAQSCLIGGEDSNLKNIICGNQTGIRFSASNVMGNTVVGNWMGVLPNGQPASTSLATAISLSNSAAGNSIGLRELGAGNLIAGADYGIRLEAEETDRNGLFGNTICGFSGEGIWLAGDGSNQNKVAPTIWYSFPSLVSGTADSNDYIELFVAEPRPGQRGGSLRFLGSATADGAGAWSLLSPVGLQDADYVCAVAANDENNTSGFSQNFFTGPTFTPTATATVTPIVTATPTVTITTTPTRVVASGLDRAKAWFFPNPAHTTVNFVFNLDQACPVAAQVFNVSGECVAVVSASLPAGKGQIMPWDCGSLAPGIYLVRLEIDGQHHSTSKLAIVH